MKPFRIITRMALLPILMLSTAALAGTNQIAEPLDFGKRLPRLILWSWEQPDSLSYIDSSRTAIAQYAGTIVLGRDLATFKKPLAQTDIPADVARFPVFRIENAHSSEEPSEKANKSAIDLIMQCLERRQTVMLKSGVVQIAAVQIDYDAKQVERKGYIAFLQNLKKRLPANFSISITALGSWCLGDRWLQSVPVDETVAMIFTMGANKEAILSAMSQTKLDSGIHCLQSLGVSISEPATNLRLRKLGYMGDGSYHIYVFSPLGWNKQRYEHLLKEVGDH